MEITMQQKLNFRKYIRVFFVISLLAIFFFSVSFGPVFYKAITDPNPPHTDGGLGMAYAVFALPVGLTLLLFLGCIYYLYLSKENLSKIGFITMAILALPVSLFGLFMFVCSIIALTHLLNQI